VINGWALALLVVGLVLRFGQSAEILIWGFNYVLLAFSGVFFPVAALPANMQVVAQWLPTTKAFQALRDVLGGQPLPWGLIAEAFVGSIIVFAFTFWCATRLLATFRRRGLVTRYS
jgi:ABC-2 type transport system permease protein